MVDEGGKVTLFVIVCYDIEGGVPKLVSLQNINDSIDFKIQKKKNLHDT